MTTKSKLLLGFGILFLGMFVFIIGTAFFFLFVSPMFAGKRAVELNLKRSAETSGTITSYSKTRSRGDKYSGSSTSTTYRFQYFVNGVKCDNDQSTGRGEKTQGMTVKVCYDPADPKSSEFYYADENKTCGK
jgi:hypothetical protein